MYEFSKVYIPRGKGELPDESLRLGLLRRADRDAYRQVKGMLDRLARVFNVVVRVVPGEVDKQVAYPNRAGYLQLGDKRIGWIGQLHPNLTDRLKIDGEAAYLELEWDYFLAAARPKQHRPRTRFPSATRDIAVVVEREVTWDSIAEVIGRYDVAFMNDYYGDELGPGKKSVAFQLTVDYPDRTPTDADADQAAGEIANKLHKHFGAELRAKP